MDQKICIIIKVTVKEGKEAELLESAQTLVTETRKEPGCIRYDLIKIDSQPNEYYLLEEFSNQETLGAHRETEHYKKYAPLLLGAGEAVFSVGKQVL